MAGPSALDLARTARQDIAVLRAEFEAFARETDTPEVRRLRERFATAEEKIATLERTVEGLKQLPVIEDRVAKLEKRAEATEKQQERLAVVESQQADMKKAKEESDKRQWQFVYIFAGAMASLLVTVVVQLVLGFVKKP
jgi:hypothetical protein